MNTYKIIDNTQLLPVLETERLILRLFDLPDASAIFAYSSDPENTKYMLWEPNKTLQATEDFIRAEREKCKSGRDYDYAIILKQSGALIGTGGAAVGEGIMAYTAEIGYILDKRYWGCGYTAEAMRALSDYLFAKNIRRIQAKHFIGNPASGRVMEKLGMKCEGTLVDYLFARGAFQTVKLYAMIREEGVGKREEVRDKR
ncbi:MAG: GNAT family N-acetyltransferase [Clostridiales bacterium]|jgi:ribosomal-protein-alanine N-acetyltransferase|nr:GNAT family N-acetyltransferase [Clostridiales bacterium]